MYQISYGAHRCRHDHSPHLEPRRCHICVCWIASSPSELVNLSIEEALILKKRPSKVMLHAASLSSAVLPSPPAMSCATHLLVAVTSAPSTGKTAVEPAQMRSRAGQSCTGATALHSKFSEGPASLANKLWHHLIRHGCPLDRSNHSVGSFRGHALVLPCDVLDRAPRSLHDLVRDIIKVEAHLQHVHQLQYRAPSSRRY